MYCHICRMSWLEGSPRRILILLLAVVLWSCILVISYSALRFCQMRGNMMFDKWERNIYKLFFIFKVFLQKHIPSVLNYSFVIYFFIWVLFLFLFFFFHVGIQNSVHFTDKVMAYMGAWKEALGFCKLFLLSINAY